MKYQALARSRSCRTEPRFARSLSTYSTTAGDAPHRVHCHIPIKPFSIDGPALIANSIRQLNAPLRSPARLGKVRAVLCSRVCRYAARLAGPSALASRAVSIENGQRWQRWQRTDVARTARAWVWVSVGGGIEKAGCLASKASLVVGQSVGTVHVIGGLRAYRLSELNTGMYMVIYECGEMNVGGRRGRAPRNADMTCNTRRSDSWARR